MSETARKSYSDFIDNIIADQMRRGLTHNNELNINAMDELDPVHYRVQREHASEKDYDGDMGAEFRETLRDNGALLGNGGFTRQPQQLPHVASPSIVPDTTAEETLSYLRKREDQRHQDERET